MRAAGEALLFVDAGDLQEQATAGRSDQSLALADVSYEALGLMGYDAMNIGRQDLAWGPELLFKSASENEVPLVSTNLEFAAKSAGTLTPWRVAKVGDVRVGILGITPAPGQRDVVDPQALTGITALAPETRLAQVAADLKGRADMVLLLSQYALDETLEMALAAGGVDVVVAPCTYAKMTPQAVKDEYAEKIAYVCYHGSGLHVIRVGAEASGRIVLRERRDLMLEDPAVADPEIAALLDGQLQPKESDCPSARQEKEYKAVTEKAEELWKMTPEEYVAYEQERAKETIEQRFKGFRQGGSE